MKDWRGTEIEVGDIILYSVKESTSVAINEAVVWEVGTKVRGYWSDMMYPYVKAYWLQSNEGEFAAKWRCIRKVTLYTIENITVIEKRHSE